MVETDRDDADGPWDGIDVYCQGCTHRFRAAGTLKGGLINCPHCSRATPVPGGPEPLFWFLLGVGILIVLGIAGAFYVSGSLTAAIVALTVGAALLLITVLAS